MSASERTYLGKSVPRFEDGRFLTGLGRYTDDIRLAGEAHCVFLRSPHAHAKIKNIDRQAALELPGVLAVLTGADYMADGLKGISHQPNPADADDIEKPFFVSRPGNPVIDVSHLPLAVDRVRFVGEPVIAVVATTADTARDAIELIEVAYDPLPAVTSPVDATLPGAPQLHDAVPRNICFSATYGEDEAARQVFDMAPRVVSHDFINTRIAACHIEPRAAIGQYDELTRQFTLYSGNQGVWRLQQLLAGALDTPPQQIRVVSPDVGGGFGSRIGLYPEQVVVLWAARRIGRPVRWPSTRSESFTSDYQGRDNVTRASLALDHSGRILAYKAELFSNLGAHTVSFVTASNASRMLTTVYDIPHIALAVHGVLTNTVPTAPYRGAGRPEAHHVIERLLDIAARRLGIDRAEIRRRNIVRRSAYPYTTAMGIRFENGAFNESMEHAFTAADWKGFPKRKRAASNRGKLAGIGTSHYVLAPTGAPFERVRLAITEREVDVIVGTQSSGQGHETSFAQVTAEILGIAPASVRIRYGDTDFVSLGGGTHADRSLRYASTLIAKAAEELIGKLKPPAAMLLQEPADRVAFAKGGFGVAGSDRYVSLFEVAHVVAADEWPLDNAIGISAQADIRARLHEHPAGAVVCEVEIDPATGAIALTRYTAVNDVGQMVNPMVVEGQVHGGIAQGVGQALLEEMVFEPVSGQVLSASFMDYGIARAADLPRFDLHFLEDPSESNPFRIKGAGECGIVPVTSAVCNAVCDALSELGVEDVPMPATPAVIWNAIKSAQPGGCG